MAGEIDEHGVTLLDDRVVDEMVHEFVFNATLRRLAVGQKADLLSGNVEVVRKPTFDRLCVIDTRLVVPDVAGLVLVDSYVSEVRMLLAQFSEN